METINYRVFSEEKLLPNSPGFFIIQSSINSINVQNPLCRPVALLQRSSHWLLSTPQKTSRSEFFWPFFLVFWLFESWERMEFFKKKVMFFLKGEKTWLLFGVFLFWRLFGVGFWRRQQLISQTDDEDLICNMSTTKSTKRSMAIQEMIYQICEVFWLCQNL